MGDLDRWLGASLLSHAHNESEARRDPPSPSRTFFPLSIFIFSSSSACNPKKTHRKSKKRPTKSRSKPDWLRKRLSNRSNGRRSCFLRLILRQAPVSPAGSSRRRRRPQSSLVGRWFHLFKLFIWERIDFGIWIGALIRVLSLGFLNWGLLNWGLD